MIHCAQAILFRRTIAAGDVLLTTPIISAFKRQQPNVRVFVETDYPEIFARNPDVIVAKKKYNSGFMVKTVDFTMAYESRINTNFTDAYAQVAEIDKEKWCPKIYPSDTDFRWAEEYLRGWDYCAIHIGDDEAHVGRYWKFSNYIPIIKYLTDLGLRIITIGNHVYPLFTVDIDLVGKTTIHQLAAVIDRCRLFIGIDSLPLHLACAMETDSIGLFGVTSPDLVLANQDHCYPVTSDPNNPCTGERHRMVTNCVFKPENDPMDTISPDQVIEKIDQMLCQKLQSTAP